MAKASKKPRARLRERRERTERRFVAGSQSHPFLVYGLAWVGALALGVAGYGMFFAKTELLLGETRGVSTVILVAAAGLAIVGAAVWLGSSGLPTIRVGDAGVAAESGELRRMPWYSVARIEWKESSQSIVVVGKDQNERPFDLEVPLRGHGTAAAWIVREAEDRVPKKVSLGSTVRSKLPSTADDTALLVRLEPLQVVGRKCAASGKVIGYEPDARVCLLCERAYLVEHAPQRCKCGASMKDGSRHSRKGAAPEASDPELEAAAAAEPDATPDEAESTESTTSKESASA